MRLSELTNTILETTEALTLIGGSPTNFLAACGDMLPEERCRLIADLCDLSQIAASLASTAADDLAEGD